MGNQLLSDVVLVISNKGAFAALKADGSVVAWGESDWGGVADQLPSILSSNVDKIVSSFGAFAALMNDGSVVVWGDLGWGADTSKLVGLGGPGLTGLERGVLDVDGGDNYFVAYKTGGKVQHVFVQLTSSAF